MSILYHSIDKMKAKDIGLVVILGALYVSIGLVIPFLSFGPIQCRVSDALYPMISFMGLPGLIGLFIGQVIFNTYGYVTGFAIGWLDLVSPLIFLPFKYLIMRFGYKAVPAHVLAVAVWVSYLLYVAFETPMIVTILPLFLGEFLAEVVMGIPLSEAVRRRSAK